VPGSKDPFFAFKLCQKSEDSSCILRGQQARVQ